jgi:ubiquinone/menaquinone biosynthesis C-methylase UbiE
MARAIEAAPTQAVFYTSYANRLLGAGRARDALAVMERAAGITGLDGNGQALMARIRAALANPDPPAARPFKPARPDDFAASNHTFWDREIVAREYALMEKLYPVEESIFRFLAPAVQGKRILEVGVGSGRLTPSLLRLSRRYLGVDYAEAMVKACAVKFPEAGFQLCDARDMSRFPDASVDFLIFGFNGIDNLRHEDRLGALRQFRRIVAPDGVMVFSTHNRNYADSSDRQPRDAGEEANRARMAPFEESCEEYAVVNDGSHGYGIVQYYITAEKQVLQLRHCGFTGVRAVDVEGKWLEESEYAQSRSCWIHYVCYPAP